MIEEAFKKGDMVGRVRRMKTQKRSLNLAGLGSLRTCKGSSPRK